MHTKKLPCIALHVLTLANNDLCFGGILIVSICHGGLLFTVQVWIVHSNLSEISVGGTAE